MCAIFGALLGVSSPMRIARANANINYIMTASRERGRDGWGYRVLERRYQGPGRERDYVRKSVVRNSIWTDNEFFDAFSVLSNAVMIGNMRAEPTTEWVKDKHEFDQQPYKAGKWTIVHNGTVANDHELRNHFAGTKLPTGVDSAAIAELLARDDMADEELGLVAAYFERQMRAVKGSYAVLAMHDDHTDAVFASCNYRPIWFARDEGDDVYFASSRDYFPKNMTPEMVEPYSTWCFTARAEGGRYRLDDVLERKGRALVVCSGGMDSVVAATAMLDAGWDVSLVHFTYGSRAQGPERNAIQSVAARLGVNLHFLPMAIYDPQDSPLLQADSQIAGGEAGAEFAHEWVPARNLVMLSLATAFAEAKGFDTIVLGNNLEEAGAYPDNEPEFINRFNDMLPFAVGDGKRLNVVMPVGNLMKHEIVALGEQLGAPMDLTWSCYRAGDEHCGTCGPCFMRRTAYKINKMQDPLPYAKEA